MKQRSSNTSLLWRELVNLTLGARRRIVCRVHLLDVLT